MARIAEVPRRPTVLEPIPLPPRPQFVPIPRNVGSKTAGTKRRRSPTRGDVHSFSLGRPGQRATLLDLEALKLAVDGSEDVWTLDDFNKSETTRRKVRHDSSPSSDPKSVEPGEIVSGGESDEDMEISDTDSEVPLSSSGPTTNTTPARSLSPSTSKLSPLQPLKDEIATHKSSSTFSLKKMEALQAAQQGGERKVPATRKSDAAPSAQAKETKPGPSTNVSEAELGVVSATQEDDSVLERPTTSLGAQTKLVPFVQGSKTITELRPVVPLSPRNMDRPPRAAAVKTKQRPGEDIEVDEGVEVDIDGEEVAAAAGEDSDSDDSDYHGEDSDEPPFSDQELNLAADPEAEDEPEDDLTYLRLMPRSVLERILQRLLGPPQSQQTRKAVQSLIQENIPETLASYDTSLRIKINETHTAMIQEMQEEHSSLTSDDFAHAMARFLRNEVRVLHSFPGSGPATFEVILYLAEHSYGDLELDDRPGFDERASFDRAADRALLYVAEERLEEEGVSFRAAIPGYLETLRSQAMYLYRHGRHPKTWFPASIAFLQSSLQPNNAKKCGRLRSATRNASPFRLQKIDS